MQLSSRLQSIDASLTNLTDGNAAGFRRMLECSPSVRRLVLDSNRLNQAAMQVGMGVERGAQVHRLKCI